MPELYAVIVHHLNGDVTLVVCLAIIGLFLRALARVDGGLYLNACLCLEATAPSTDMSSRDSLYHTTMGNRKPT